MSEQTRQCPVTEWFQFKGECAITTCMHHNGKTKGKCLKMDRVAPQGVKPISDAELLHYKFSEKVSPRLVAYKRKRAIARITSAVVLTEYIPWLRNNRRAGNIRFSGVWIDRYEHRVPFSIKKLGFENWMWEYILESSSYAEFSASKDGECKKLAPHDVIAVTPAKFNRLQNEVKQCLGARHE